MTPAARTQAAIELVGMVEQSFTTPGRSADQIIRTYFKARRYAGSGDRGQVTEQVFSVLRRRAEWIWRLGDAVTPTPRLLVAAAIAAGGGLDPSAVARLFDGSDYGPAVLSAEEVTSLAQLGDQPSVAPPAWVQGNFPEWLLPHLDSRFGADLGPEMAALNGRAPLDLRANTLKGRRQKGLEALAADGVAAAPTALSPLGLRVTGRSRITGLDAYTRGLVDIQDEGSQVASLLADARPGMQVVDLCAGAGGKTLALAAAMENRGQIYAVDDDRRRLRQMEPRLLRAGARNVQIRHCDAIDPDTLADLDWFIDRVVVDAPCTGTGAWRRNPDAKWRLTPDMLARHIARQDRLLDRAAGLVKPGGRLVYVTCSLLPDENEERIDAFLNRNQEFQALPIREVWEEAVGTAFPDQAEAGDFLLLTPRRHETDGFFVAVLTRVKGGGVLSPRLDLPAGER